LIVANRPPTCRPSVVRAMAAAALLAVLGSSVAAPAAQAVGPDPGQRPAAAPELAPSAGGALPGVHYEDWLRHADDAIPFEPGGRVTVPFRPRAGDRARVGGGRPRALPAGRASGHQMAATPQGQAWAPVPGALDAPVDAPIVDPGSVVDAEPSGWTTTTATPPATDAAAGLRKEVFGFLPYWEVSDTSTTLDYDVLSTIAYFGVGADRYGNLVKRDADGSVSTGWGGWTSTRLTSIIDAAHRHGTRVVLTVQAFAWTDLQQAHQAALLGSPAARTNLARQAVAAVRDRGADGINLDFEPIVSGYADEFTALVREIRTGLDAVAPGYQLTFDTTGWIGNYPIEAATAPGGADAIFVMGYDYRTASATRAGSIAPLRNAGYDIVDTLDAYLARVSGDKLILGVPYYGRAWSTTSDALNATTQTGEKYGYSSAVIYTTAVEYLAEHGRRYDAAEDVAWTAYRRQNCTSTYGCVTSWRELYIDDVTALKAKYDLVNRRGLRGVGIWALGYDGTRTELYAALAAKFLDDTTPPRAGVRPLEPVARIEGVGVAWTGADETGVVSYDVQVARDGGAWTDWLTGTTATTDRFPAASGHRYAFRVRARDSHGNVSAWDIATTDAAPSTIAVGGFVRVGIDGLARRSSADTSATKVGELRTGDLLQVTGGPVAADGYTWWRLSGPLSAWGPVEELGDETWSAAGTASTTYLAPRQAPNVTVVDAAIAGLRFGATTFSPNGDGTADRLRVSWTNDRAFDAMTLLVHRPDGTLVGRHALGAQAAGDRTVFWDGRADDGPVADGDVVLTLTGTAGPATYMAPAPAPLPASLATAYQVTIDRFVTARIAGADRYATAAAVSAATFKTGAPVAYVATGSDFPDALAGSVAAARAGGPILLVGRDTLPAATATELARLEPGRIVVLGAPAVVSDGVLAAAKAAALAR
jgi:spore germination protein YaaH